MQYDIACILHINNSNRMFCSIHDFTFLMTDTKIKEQVSLECWDENKYLLAWFLVKFITLPAWSAMLANLICLHTCLYKHDCADVIHSFSITVHFNKKFAVIHFCQLFQDISEQQSGVTLLFENLSIWWVKWNIWDF